MKQRKSISRNYAVALGYSSSGYGDSDKYPKVLACGAGEIAKRILELAEENNIAIKQDEELLSILSNFEAGSTIPEESFQIVSEILAFLFKADLEWPKTIPNNK